MVKQFLTMTKVFAVLLFCTLIECSSNKKNADFVVLKLEPTGQHIYLRGEKDFQNVFFNGDSLKQEYESEERACLVQGNGKIRWFANVIKLEGNTVTLNDVTPLGEKKSYILSREGALVEGFLREFE